MSLKSKHSFFRSVVEASRISPDFYRIFSPQDFLVISHVRLREVGYCNALKADLPKAFLDNSLRWHSGMHRWGVLHYMLNGRMKFIDHGKELWVEPGQAAFFPIPSETAYYDSVDLDAEWFFFTFSGPTAMAITDELVKENGYILRDLDHSQLVPAVAQMFSRVMAHSPLPFFEFSTAVYNILMELSAHTYSYRNNYPEPIAFALELIEQNFSDADFSLDDIAAEVCLSKGYFSRMFKESIGESPGAYLCNKRMRTAMDLLLHSSKPIKEIQYLCGYKKYNYFLTAFRKVYGISPGKVRR